MVKDEKLVTVEGINLDIVHEREEEKRKMLRKHEGMCSWQLGEINVTDMRIYLMPYSKPLTSLPLWASQEGREFERREIGKQLKAEIIDTASSEWAAPELFVSKKDGKLHFCIEYRRLDSMKVKDTYLLPQMYNIDTLGDAEYFTILDAYSGYLQMMIRQQKRPKTALLC